MSCSARSERVLPWKLEQSIPERFRHKRLGDLEPLPEGIREYCGDLAAIRCGNGLILIGPTGTGKTTLAVAILSEIAANARQQNMIVKWETFARFVTAHDLADISRDFDSGEYQQHKKIKLLIIDDIGTSRLTDFGETELASLFDYRYAALLPTIITSNLDAPEFKQYMGERSLSRFVECSQMIKLLGPDRRLAQERT